MLNLSWILLALIVFNYIETIIILYFIHFANDLLPLQTKDGSDLKSWKSHISMQFGHLLRDNAVLR